MSEINKWKKNVKSISAIEGINLPKLPGKGYTKMYNQGLTPVHAVNKVSAADLEKKKISVFLSKINSKLKPISEVRKNPERDSFRIYLRKNLYLDEVTVSTKKEFPDLVRKVFSRVFDRKIEFNGPRTTFWPV